MKRLPGKIGSITKKDLGKGSAIGMGGATGGTAGGGTGAAVGFVVGGPPGAAIGWLTGVLVGMAFGGVAGAKVFDAVLNAVNDEG